MSNNIKHINKPRTDASGRPTPTKVSAIDAIDISIRAFSYCAVHNTQTDKVIYDISKKK